MLNLKNDANELFNKAEMDALTENKFMATKEKGGIQFLKNQSIQNK